MSTTTRPEITEDLTTFFTRYYEDAVKELAANYPHDQTAVEIDWLDLFTYDQELAEAYLEDPDYLQPHLEEAVARVPVPVDRDLDDAHVRVRPHENDVYGVDGVGAADIGEFVGLEGQVTKRTQKQPRPEQLAFECQRCGTITAVMQDGDGVVEPHECQGCERQGPFRDRPDHENTALVDHQIVRLKRPPEETKGGDGAHIDVHLEDDLVNGVEPGDRAQINGVLTLDLDRDGDTRTLLQGRSTEVEETDFTEIDVDEHRDGVYALARGDEGDPYELLIDSLAPKLKYDREIKEAVALQLFGGVAVEYPNGNYDRGDSHILLLGDPGTGKSTLLRAVEEISPRSAYASGKGASAAGMTAAATPDDFGSEKWSLEAGALVLANNGVACVDEIDKIDEGARQSLHDALESQRVNVNKAGINATLPAKTALLAGGNPEYGRFDPYEPMADQIDLGPTLLSRFDLIYLLSDDPDRDEDETVSRHGIESRHQGIRYTKGDEAADRISPAVDRDLLRAWVALARQEVTPEWRDESVRESLVDSFVELRQVNTDEDGADQPIPVTYRVQESIARLAEASARVRLSDVVTQDDLDRARRLVGKSLKQVGMDPDSGQYDADLVEADASTSQREAMRTIEAIIEERSDAARDGGWVDVGDVLAAASDEGLNEDRTRDRLKQLKTKGRIVWNDDADELRPTF